MKEKKFVGSPLKRREDNLLLSGDGVFVDDIKFPGLLHAAILRSTYAHAKIKNVNLKRALSVEGVVAALCGEDIRKVTKPLPLVSAPPFAKRAEVYMLAVDKVHYTGEPVAVVLARDRYVAEDSLEEIEVNYEPLEAVVDVERASQPDSPLLYSSWGDNTSIHTTLKAGNTSEAFKGASNIFKERIVRHRVSASPLETRGYLASYDIHSGRLVYYASTQMPHVFRTLLSRALDLSENKIKVIAPHVGGAFGQKAPVYQEEPLIAYLSILSKRPVKWIETRNENLKSASHARQQVHLMELAVTSEGNVTAIRDKMFGDMGAFLPMPGIGSIFSTATTIPSGYKIEHYDAEVYMVHTNKAPFGAYRGYGKADANFVIELALDRIARKLGIDPVELRLRNFIQPRDFPYRSCTGKLYDSGDYPTILLKAVREIDYHGFKKKQKELWKRRIYKGISVAFLLEPSASAVPDSPLSGFESATIRIEPTGRVTLLSGMAAQGQGHETVLSQVVADELTLRPEEIDVLEGDSSASPYGLGAWSSRFSVAGVGATVSACRKMRSKLLQIAGVVLSVPIEDLRLRDGKIISEKRSEISVSISDIAEVAYTKTYLLPENIEPCLEETSRYILPKFGEPTWGSGAYAVTVDVDIETGKFKIEKQVFVSDCGTVLNPLTLDGQIMGGIAQGIGATMYENLVYDSQGELLSSTFTDYLLPTSLDIPGDIAIFHVNSKSPITPLGSKGAAEGGAIVPPYGLTNAVVNALSPFGIERIDQPLSPENIWKVISAVTNG